jgi:hypothetical protein
MGVQKPVALQLLNKIGDRIDGHGGDRQVGLYLRMVIRWPIVDLACSKIQRQGAAPAKQIDAQNKNPRQPPESCHRGQRSNSGC